MITDSNSETTDVVDEPIEPDLFTLTTGKDTFSTSDADAAFNASPVEKAGRISAKYPECGRHAAGHRWRRGSELHGG
jgi:hypothetical protein